MVNVHLHRTLLAFNLNLFVDGYNKVVSINTFQYATHLTPLCRKHLDGVSHVVFILLTNLKRLSQAGRAYLKLIVFLVTADVVFDKLAQFSTVFYPHAVSVIDFYRNLVIRADRQVNKELLGVLQPLFNQILNDVFVNHILLL